MMRQLTRQLPNVLTLLRLVLALAGFRAGVAEVPSLPAVCSFFLLSAALDLVDGWLARRLGATSSLGAALDLLVDAAMWFLLYYLAFVVAEPSLAAAFVLLMTLELATSATVLVSIHRPTRPAHWKETFQHDGSQQHPLRRLVKAYFSRGMKNVLGATGNISHLVLPAAIYCRRQALLMMQAHEQDNGGGGDAALASSLAYMSLVAVVAALPGFALYVLVTCFMLASSVAGWAEASGLRDICASSKTIAGSAFACVAAYQALTAPLGLKLLLDSARRTTSSSRSSTAASPLGGRCGDGASWCPLDDAAMRGNSTMISGGGAEAILQQQTDTWGALARFLALRVVTLTLALGIAGRCGRRCRDNEGMLRAAAALWTLAYGQLGYWEVGAVLPMLHAEHYLRDLAIDKAVIQAEAWLFGGFQPARDLGGLLGAARGTPQHEAWYLIYFSFVPTLLTLIVVLVSRSTLLFGGSEEEREIGRRRRDFVCLRLAATFCCCWLSYLCCPVYGPVIMFGPRDTVVPAPHASNRDDITTTATAATTATTTTVSNTVWSMGKSYASTGTALPSSHCAVTASAAMALYACAHERQQHAKRSNAASRLRVRQEKMEARIAAIFAALICVAVVVCGMHYVTDAVLGVLLAAAVAFFLPPAAAWPPLIPASGPDAAAQPLTKGGDE